MANSSVQSSYQNSRTSSGLGAPCVRSCGRKSFVALLLLVLLTLKPMTTDAQANFAGKITSIDSGSAPKEISIIRPGKKGLVSAALGDEVLPGDTVRTGTGVKAQIVFADESVINMAAGSNLRIKTLALNGEEGKRNYVFRVLKGTIRFIVSNVNKAARSPRAWRDSNVAVETSTAVAGIRGTDLIVVVNRDGSADIAVLLGKVVVWNNALSTAKPVTVRAQQITRVDRGALPQKPMTLLPPRRDLMMRSTTPAQTRGAAGAGLSSKPAGKYSKADAARDIAAGKTISDLLNRAAESEIGVGEMVSIATSAGFDAGVVVYAAIQEGYSTDEIVASAISGGASLDNVVAAAIRAGGLTSAVVAGALEAGAAPDYVATAVANSAPPTAPVYGDSTPDSTSGVATVPAAPVSVSDGGGATPSTQPASPYLPK